MLFSSYNPSHNACLTSLFVICCHCWNRSIPYGLSLGLAQSNVSSIFLSICSIWLGFFWCSNSIVLPTQTAGQEIKHPSLNVCHNVMCVIYCSHGASVSLWRFSSWLEFVMHWHLCRISASYTCAISLCLSWHISNQLVLFHPSSMAAFPAADLMHVTVHIIFVFLKSALYPLADDLYLFLLNEVYVTFSFLFITNTIVVHGNVRPHCEHGLTYGGGRPHEFSLSDIEPYIVPG